MDSVAEILKDAQHTRGMTAVPNSELDLIIRLARHNQAMEEEMIREGSLSEPILVRSNDDDARD